MADMVNISVANAGVTALLGYCVVFLGIVILMAVIMLMGRAMKKETAPAAEPAAPAVEEEKPAAPGSAGELKLYDTDPRDAALCMAIVADKLGKPINELRFISIKEVKGE